MPKIDLSASKDLFELAISYSNAAERDQQDPASSNLLLSLHNYFQSTATSLIAIAAGVDALSERLDAIERRQAGAAGLSTKLK